MERWVKLYCKIDRWEWSDNPFMVALFIRLLTMANPTDTMWHGITVKKGQLITSVASLAKKTGLSVKQVRTCLERLKSTNEVASKTTNKYTIITICKYESYQDVNFEKGKQNGEQMDKQRANKGQTKGKQRATDIEDNSIIDIKDDIEDSIDSTREKNLEKRKEKFVNETNDFIAQYGEKMIAEFINYWTEVNRSKTKMRFELQTTFEISKRLVTWKRNDDKKLQPTMPPTQLRRNDGRISPAQALKDLRAKYGKQLENNTEEAQFELL